MASTTSTPAANQPRRATRRIVPAIPLALTRRPPSTRPITPEGTTTAPLPSPGAGLKRAEQNGAPEQARDGPLTPPTQASSCGSHAEDAAPSGATVAPDSSPGPVAASASPTIELPAQEPPPNIAGPSVDGEKIAPEPATASASTLREPESQIQLPEVDKSPPQPVSSVAPSHGARPSVDRLVFGNTKPQAPPSAPHVHGQMSGPFQSISANPPGLGGPPFALPVHPPSQNPPTPQPPQWPSAGLTNGSHGQIAGSNHSHHSPVVGNGERPDSYNGQMAAYSASTMASGSSRSESQSPSKPRSNEVKHSSLTQEFPDYTASSPVPGVESRNIPSVPPNAPLMMAPLQATSRRPELSEYARGAIELAVYISAQIRRPEFADLTLKVRRGETILLDMPAHRIVLARSLNIGNTMLENVRQNRSPHVVDLTTDSMFVSTESLNEAIKFLYGAPLLTADAFLTRLEPFRLDTAQSAVTLDACHRMRNAISFAATGQFLDLYSVHVRGMEIVKALLRWDTLEVAIDYAWTACHQFGKHRLVTPEPENREEAFAGQLLEHDIVDFIAFNFPRGFSLDTNASELRPMPRLPFVAERPSHNPRLSQIRFGDVPAETNIRPDFVTQTLSSFLLSMPLRILDRVFNHPAVVNQLKWRGSDNMFGEVITERERRREETLHRYRRNQSSLRLENDSRRSSLVYNLLCKEYIRSSPQHPSGYTVSERQIDPF